jgi:FKBP-type peptidyl-prolyl cis-trans isomerase FkpA/FKBP-type peptidyl-prolyl cis-trans isomerase FklB
MKSIRLIAAALVLVGAVACNTNNGAGNASGADSTAVASAAATVNPESLLPSKAELDSVSYLMGINWGSMLKGYNFGELNMKEVQKGINDFLNSKGNQRDTNFVKQFKIDPNEMNRLFTDFMEKRNEYTAAVNKEAETKFFAENQKKSGVETSASGLQYIIKEAGNDEKPGPQDTVYVHYKLTDKDGNVIEEIAPEQDAVMLTLNRVIPGWTEGLQLIGEGGKATLFVPSALGYGDRGQGGIEPNSPLVFDLQLDSVVRFVPEVPAE